MQGRAKEVVNALTEKVIDLMKKHGSQWTKPFANQNFISVNGHEYSGMNFIWLSFQQYKRKVYGTYRQWLQHGCQVKKGSKSTKLLFYKTYKKEVEEVEKTFKLLRTFDVFNIEQVDGPVEKFDGLDKKPNLVNDIQAAETFVSNTGAVIKDGGKACYIPSKDYIMMPTKDTFADTEHSTATENYYCTMFHELIHWTGNEKRCNRKLSTTFGSKNYAFEELVAELGSCFLASHLNITSNPREDHAMYLNNWIQCLEENESAIWKASSLAKRGYMYCRDLQPQSEQQPKEVAA